MKPAIVIVALWGLATAATAPAAAVTTLAAPRAGDPAGRVTAAAPEAPATVRSRSVPVPAILALVAIGLTAGGLVRRRRQVVTA